MDQEANSLQRTQDGSERNAGADCGLDWFQSLSGPGLSPIAPSSQNASSGARGVPEGHTSLPSSGGPLPEKGRESTTDETPFKNIDEAGPSNRKNTATTARDKSESVVEKVSKSLRGKRLKKIGHSTHQGEGVVAEIQARSGGENADRTDNLELSFSVDALPSHSTPVAVKKRSSKKSRAPHDRPTGGREAPEPEGPPEALRTKLSSFTFRPRDRLAHGEGHSGPPERVLGNGAGRDPVSGSGDRRGVSANRALGDAGFEEEAAVSVKQTKKSEERNGERKRDTERPAEGSKVCKKLRSKAAAEKQAHLPEGSGDRGKRSEGGVSAGYEEQRRRQLLQRLSLSTAGAQPPQPQTPRATVASSTLAKLSHFSFADSSEERPGKPEATARLETGQGHDLAPGHDGNNPRKRKCFEFGSKSILPGQSLFSSSLIDEGELDVDWEEESSKRAKE